MPYWDWTCKWSAEAKFRPHLWHCQNSLTRLRCRSLNLFELASYYYYHPHTQTPSWGPCVGAWCIIRGDVVSKPLRLVSDLGQGSLLVINVCLCVYAWDQWKQSLRLSVLHYVLLCANCSELLCTSSNTFNNRRWAEILVFTVIG